MDYTILVGGAAGQGIETMVMLLEKIIKRNGYYVFTYRDYMSMVRGGHNFMMIRFSNKRIYTFNSQIDMICPLNEETVDLHKGKLKEDGIIILDENIKADENYMHLPIKSKAKAMNNPILASTIIIGAISKYLGLSPAIGKEVLNDSLGEDIIDINIQALEEGYKLTERKLNPNLQEENQILISGNEALALGAIAAGCKLYTGYPMTPATSVMNYLSRKSKEMGIVVDQAEDEIAALNMIIGASYGGIRAMTGTSGGGFALMVEALSLAGILEVPAVIINAQRPGPATGLSTKTEQCDLRFMIHGGHGEFPRMMIALLSPEDAFYQVVRGFNLADKYQIPVIILTDEYLADYTMTIDPFDFNRLEINRYIAKGEDIVDERYKPYKFTGDGISPRLIPGKARNHLVLADSHEHNEYGNIDEDPVNRRKMVDKRMKKMEVLIEDIEEPWFIGRENPEKLIVSWGSTFGVLKEVVEELNDAGDSIGALIYGDIWPFPTKLINKYGKKASTIINIEQNATGQLEGLIRQYTDIKCNHRILKYDGRPFDKHQIIEGLKRCK